MIRRLLPVAGLATLTACGSSPPPQTFPPLDYSYLPPITLRVANISVQDDYVPDAGAATLLGQDPEPPAQALTDELNHRLVASGAPGNATATIETASIDQIGGNITGTLTVEINVSSADGLHTGYTEASVTQSDTAPDPDSSENQVQAALYQMTQELMNQMNVQLQYQIQHNLSSWVVFGPGAGPAPLAGPASTGIQAAPLPPPSTNAPAANAQTLPGGISPTAIPPGAPIPLTPEGPSPTPTLPAPATPTAIPPAPPSQTAPVPLTPSASPAKPAAPAAPPAFNPANVGL